MGVLKLTAVVCVLALVLPWRAALAEDIEWRQGNNAAVLPQYCQDRLDKNGKWQNWRAHFGQVFIHMHHYCGGVYAEYKAKTALNKRQRERWLRETIVQMRYVSPHCGRECVVFEELHRRWAWALTQQGKMAEATEHLRLIGSAP